MTPNLKVWFKIICKPVLFAKSKEKTTVDFLGRCVIFGEMLGFLHSLFWPLLTEADSEKLLETFPSLLGNMADSLVKICKENSGWRCLCWLSPWCSGEGHTGNTMCWSRSLVKKWVMLSWCSFAALEHDQTLCRFIDSEGVFILLVSKGTLDSLCRLLTCLEVSGGSNFSHCSMFSVFSLP